MFPSISPRTDARPVRTDASALFGATASHAREDTVGPGPSPVHAPTPPRSTYAAAVLGASVVPTGSELLTATAGGDIESAHMHAHECDDAAGDSAAARELAEMKQQMQRMQLLLEQQHATPRHAPSRVFLRMYAHERMRVRVHGHVHVHVRVRVRV